MDSKEKIDYGDHRNYMAGRMEKVFVSITVDGDSLRDTAASIARLCASRSALNASKKVSKISNVIVAVVVGLCAASFIDGLGFLWGYAIAVSFLMLGISIGNTIVYREFDKVYDLAVEESERTVDLLNENMREEMREEARKRGKYEA